jgi:hypothetical protein
MKHRKYSFMVKNLSINQRGVFFMSVLSKELVQEIIEENDFKSPGEIISFLKEAFKDVLQEMLEAEMDVSLGYSRDDLSRKTTDNSRNGYSAKN